MVLLTEGDHVWIPDPGQTAISAPIGAVIRSVDEKSIELVDDEGREHLISIDSPIRLMHPKSINGVENLAELEDVHEASTLRNIFIRYKSEQIYTYIGEVLLAVNPCRSLDIYNDTFVEIYRNRRIGELEPHIFAIAENAFRRLKDGESNNIVITGESGAGKTESCKRVTHYLCAISGEKSFVEEQILQTDIILEAFGNAKTVNNDNSSRFGKYLEVHFDDRARITGAKLTSYLLEMTRVVHQSSSDKNYHIFYSLLAGLESPEREELGLDGSDDFFLLNQTHNNNYKLSRGDAGDFAKVLKAFQTLNFSGALVQDIIKVVATLLHLGNVEYHVSTNNLMEICRIDNTRTLNKAAELLQVNSEDLSKLLTAEELLVQGDRVTRNLSVKQALDTRDGLIKALYGALFTYVLKFINSTLNPSSDIGSGKLKIGVLDLFGFEIVHQNRFEQLCINYANERLHQLFVKVLFKLEQTEYAAQKIHWDPIEFVDNTEALDVLARGHLSIMSLLNEECLFPQGTDKSLLLKMNQNHGQKVSVYSRPKSDLSLSFAIKHYAGNVFYNAKGFVDRNRDHFGQDLRDLLQNSKSELIRDMFKDYPQTQTLKQTVATSFQKSLDALFGKLESSKTSFIRCLKPNDKKEPQLFSRSCVLRQLRYMGVLDVIKIRKAGYEIRRDYFKFVDRFRGLVPGIRPARYVDCIDASYRILSIILGPEADFQMGKTKIFLKSEDDIYLEREREVMLNFYATSIQKHLKGFIIRRAYSKQKRAAVEIQRHWKGFTQRKRYRNVLNGIARLQAILRSQHLVSHFTVLSYTVTELQARCRGALLRRRLRAGNAPSRMERPRNDENADTPEDLGQKLDYCFEFLNAEADRKPEEPLTLRSKAEGEFLFEKFAVAMFQHADPYHSRAVLHEPLLRHSNKIDQLASLAIWQQILRFCGDLKEIKKNENEEVEIDPVQIIYTELSKAMPPTSRVSMTPKSILTGSCSSVATHSLSRKLNYLKLYGQHLTSVQKIHFIIAHGILREGLRDEIYAGLLKLLNRNPNPTSSARGWLLLSLCVGCFAPSPRLLPYLKSFVATRLDPESSYFISTKLDRCLANGTRRQPPNSLEIQATKARQDVILPVMLPNLTTKSLRADSAVTAHEVCTRLAQKAGIKQTFGFSLFISADGNVGSLGAGADSVMDAISRIEQLQACQSEGAESPVWKLFYRKEVFSPWQNPRDDPIATSLIYEQIVRGFHYNELDCSEDDDIALLAAQQLFVKHGDCEIEVSNLEIELETVLPISVVKALDDLATEKWVQLVMNMFRKIFSEPSMTPEDTKAQVVEFARRKWPLHFSRFYKSEKFAGPPLPTNDVILGVSSNGVAVMIEGQTAPVQNWTYAEISGVVSCSSRRIGTDAVIIQIFNGVEYSFHSANAIDIKELILFFIQGLRKRSHYLIVTEDIFPKKHMLPSQRGDVLYIEDPSSRRENSYVTATNMRTKETGSVPTKKLMVVPSLQPPSGRLVSFFTTPKTDEKSSKNDDDQQSQTLVMYNNSTLDLVQVKRAHTLEAFALTTFKDYSGEMLWKFSRIPIQQPLLKHLCTNEKMSQRAVQVYLAAMKFMGDFPEPGLSKVTDLTDRIFKPTLKHETLRDELFCQIMKQLTDNPSAFSEDRGWKLLWLCLGLFPPSSNVYKELVLFLRSRYSPKAIECIARLNKIVKARTVRKRPPHHVEVQSVLANTPDIYHKIYLPDGSSQIVEIESCDTAEDVGCRIAEMLHLKDVSGCNLFVKVGQKAVSIPDEEHFFDYLGDLALWAKPDNPAQFAYQILYMRKLWLEDVKVTDDENSSLILHYPQEVPKYLRGYHNIRVEDAPRFGALILRGQTRDDQPLPLQQLQHIIDELVPKDIVKGMSQSEWKKAISSECQKLTATTSSEAKLTFLKELSQWPSFGSAFFEVKQSSDPNMPTKVTLAINRHGLSVYNPENKHVIASYPFSAMVDWTAGNTYFHLTLGNMVKSARVLVETTLGYKIDDLLTSYIRLSAKRMQRQQA